MRALDSRIPHHIDLFLNAANIRTGCVLAIIALNASTNEENSNYTKIIESKILRGVR